MGLSVLTLAKGRHAHLARLIEGLARSEQLPDELVIVDMNEAALVVPPQPFAVQLIRAPGAGLALARARNLAAAAAGHELLLFLDVDCIPMRRLAGTMLAALRDGDRLLCAPVFYLGAQDARDGWDEDELRRTAVAHPARAFPASGIRVERNAGLFWSLCFGISCGTFARLGGFDERFSGYGAEDTDFGFAAAAAGVELGFIGGAGAFHQYHGVSDPPLQHFEDIVRNAGIFYAKWGRWPMEGWLRAFQAMGLISWSQGGIVRLRPPSARELNDAMAPAGVRF